jgi:hypothetical protein
LEARQHDIIRDEHTRMKQSLITVGTFLRSGHRKKHQGSQTEAEIELLVFLDRVLEFSSTWNGVETKEFFPPSPKIEEYLNANDMHRLGKFFSRQFIDVSKALRVVGIEYPLLLKKLYEAYYLRTLRRGSTPKEIISS